MAYYCMQKRNQKERTQSSDSKVKNSVPKLSESAVPMKRQTLPAIIVISQSDDVSIATSIGRRDNQEDCYVSEVLTMQGVKNGQGQLMAVFDGHNGPETAMKISKSLYGVFSISLAMHKGNIAVAMKDAISNLSWLTSDKEAGSTLSMAYIPKDSKTAHVAVIGDSPVIIIDKDCKVNVSPDHNVRTNPVELEKAQKKGAFYSLGYIMDPKGGGLQISRALGDKHLDSILDREPDIYSVPIGEKSIVIIGTDGLFDPGHGDTAAQIGRITVLAMNGAGAKELVHDALSRMTCDNVTAIVWCACR